MSELLEGRCACGAVRYASRARIGLCLFIAVAGCIDCPPTYFAKGARFDVTVVQATVFETSEPLCAGGPASRPRSLADGDVIEAIGSGDEGTESCDHGYPRALDTPAFATDILTGCDGNYCRGMTASGCPVVAMMYMELESPVPASGTARGTLEIQWSGGDCDPGFNCAEQYEVAFIRRDN